MKDKDHFRALERMYLAAPINEIFNPQITVTTERADITIEVKRNFFHSAGAVHGSVYFKMMDDAAFFAANSIVPDFFVLTTSFTTYMTKPISSGRMKSVGKVVTKGKKQIIAEAVVYDAHGEEIGRGSGIFMRSSIPLSDAWGYSE